MSAAILLGRNRHRFAPLNKQSYAIHGQNLMELQGVVFDMDGTLYMFQEMRSALSMPNHVDILDHIHSLSPPKQQEAFETIQEIERQAMRAQVPSAGLVTLMEFLDRRELRKGICTRNFDAPVNHLLATHLPSHISAFAPIVTRDFRPPKPSPAGILHIARAWGLLPDPESTPADSLARHQFPLARKLLPIVMVGDSADDMIAGYEAGAMTVLLRSKGKEGLETDERTDVVLGRLDELISLMETGLHSTRS